MKPFLFYLIAVVLLSSCGGGGSESSNELLDQDNQTPTDQADQIQDVNQESISQDVTFGGSSFGYTKFQ